MKILLYSLSLFCLLFIPAIAHALDSDGDGLSDELELTLLHTDPLNPDTDGDGFNDKEEVDLGFSPRHERPIKLGAVDTDRDGLPDSWEIRLGTDLANFDTDGDFFDDGQEVRGGYSPTSTERVLIEKRIEVDLAKQQLAYFFAGVELERFPISSGLPHTPTPRGEYPVLAKMPVHVYAGPGYYLPNTKWNIHFATGYARFFIHGAYWHNNFGQPMSHGCVNVSYDNMPRLYSFTDSQTKIVIY
jgi:hypothetical protein